MATLRAMLIDIIARFVVWWVGNIVEVNFWEKCGISWFNDRIKAREMRKKIEKIVFAEACFTSLPSNFVER